MYRIGPQKRNLEPIWRATLGIRAATMRAVSADNAKREGHTWRVLGIPQELDEDDRVLLARACKKVGIPVGSLLASRVAKRAVDARRGRGVLRFVCHVDLVVPPGKASRTLAKAERSGRARPVANPVGLAPPSREGLAKGAHVVVVGSGPAGIFAALPLALAGLRVTLLERGASLENRHKRLVPFHRGGPLDPNTNLLFGEGGAGTYSDGKLYTRVDDPLEAPILQELIAAGAPPGIAFDARAHIGTDRLHTVLPNLRRRLQDLGVEFAWDTVLEGLVLEPGPPARVRAVRTSSGELAADALVLALGHSARDSMTMLLEEGLVLHPKPFQFGVRVEHSQELVTAGRYGTGAAAQQLGAASYALVAKAGDGLPGAHSFCMCPGGKIVASVSEEGALCTNGMSNSTHSSPFANAAIVVTVRPEAFLEHGSGPLAGLEWQRYYEQLFFRAGGSDYCAPAQRVPDFLARRESSGELRTSYTFGARPGRIDQLLPAGVAAPLARALERFDRAIPGFAGPEGILVGVEARSSGPIQMERDPDSRLATGFANLYPVGEGAGYAGGIMSAAIDGARSAHALCCGNTKQS